MAKKSNKIGIGSVIEDFMQRHRDAEMEVIFCGFSAWVYEGIVQTNQTVS